MRPCDHALAKAITQSFNKNRKKLVRLLFDGGANPNAEVLEAEKIVCILQLARRWAMDDNS